MKISLVCESLLLKKSLEIFLKDSVTTHKNSDMILSDRKITANKPVVTVGYTDKFDIVAPFSKSDLLANLRMLYRKRLKRDSTPKSKNGKKDINMLENEIEKLTVKFREDLIKTIREYYEK
ncbi:MAG: hypothetical protein GXO12_06400 [Epsilonproteobacteria bacterium]|nr:hypothetical protein [Campylobacterota bacterium]